MQQRFLVFSGPSYRWCCCPPCGLVLLFDSGIFLPAACLAPDKYCGILTWGEGRCSFCWHSGVKGHGDQVYDYGVPTSTAVLHLELHLCLASRLYFGRVQNIFLFSIYIPLSGRRKLHFVSRHYYLLQRWGGIQNTCFQKGLPYSASSGIDEMASKSSSLSQGLGPRTGKHLGKAASSGNCKHQKPLTCVYESLAIPANDVKELAFSAPSILYPSSLSSLSNPASHFNPM